MGGTEGVGSNLKNRRIKKEEELRKGKGVGIGQ